MPLPIEETTKVSELTEAVSLSGTDELLITRPGSSVRAAISLLLEYMSQNIDISGLAPLDSPALTGTPTGPTAEPDDASDALATTAFVDAVKQALVGIISGLTASDVGADAAGSAANAISGHNDESDAHGSKAYANSVATDAEVAAKDYADLLVSSVLSLRGGYDASGNVWPTTGGNGVGGAIKTGNLWFVSVAGTLNSKPVVAGDAFFAVADTPGQTDSNWCVLDANLGFVPETAGAAAAAIASHLLAVDPHGDRSYADSAAGDALDAAKTYTDDALAGFGSGARENVAIVATSLANNANYTFHIAIADRYQVLQVTTDFPCRLRLYTSQAKRDADLSRPSGTDPTGDHGLVLEFISSALLLAADMSPVVDGFSATSTIYYSLTNLSGATQTITATLNLVKTGAV